jgi:SOS-response transcriptional repressor LexA
MNDPEHPELLEPHERLRWARVRWQTLNGIKPEMGAAADSLGMKQHTYRAYEREPGASKHTPLDHQRAVQFARKFGVSWQWLLTGENNSSTSPTKAHVAKPGAVVDLAELRSFISRQPRHGGTKSPLHPRRIARHIPVLGAVAAGIWRETVVREMTDAAEFLPIDVPGYERAQLSALLVEGPSMDMVYPPGRYVVVAHPSEAGLRVGDYVVVQRQKADVYEITLKEFSREPDGRIALWPRSYHPDYQTPIYLVDGGELDQTAPTIIGVVVADYAKRERPPIVFKPSED